jgi:hypothetical protein
MSDDLNTAETNDSTLDDAEVEFTTREEYITCSVNALNAVAEMNCMTKADNTRKERITRKCLRILDDMVGEMYDELFNEDETE